MFTDSKIAATERGLATLDREITALNSNADTWFDQTPNSVDRRIANVKSVLATATSSVLMEQPADHVLAAVDALQDELQMLTAFREDMLGNDTFDAPRARQASVAGAALSPYGREFVATHLNTFVSSNEEAITDAAEMDIRAAAYADMHVSGLPVSEAEPIVEAFRAQVASRVRKPAPVRQASASIDFPDELLFD